MTYLAHPQSQNPAAKLIVRIEELLKNNNPIEARKLCKKLCKKNKKNPQAWFLMSSIHAQLNEYSDAEQCCLILIKLYPDFPMAHFNLGLAYQKTGKIKKAITSMHDAIQLQPDFIKAHVNLGDLYKTGECYSQAIKAYQSALNIEPQNTEVYKRLAYVYILQENIKEAIKCYQAIVQHTPSDTDTWLLIATMLASNGALKEAETTCTRALEKNKNDFRLLCEFGKILCEQDKAIEALDVFQKAKLIEPDDAEINYLISEFKQDKTTLYTDKQKYIASVFDNYADTFDSHLSNTLEYRTPQLIHQLALDIYTNPIKLNILDLGCGTGLCGVYFHNIASSLTGVDLSQRMIDKARERNLYSALYKTDIVDALEHSENKYDLVLAADVFVYVGNLSEIITGCKNTLKKGGILIFSVESVEGDSYKLRASGRYGHSTEYIQSLAASNHFSIKATRKTTIRKEGTNAIMGRIFAMEITV